METCSAVPENLDPHLGVTNGQSLLGSSYSDVSLTEPVSNLFSNSKAKLISIDLVLILAQRHFW